MSSTRPHAPSPAESSRAAQQRAILERIDCGTDLAALADVDLVVEAVPEHLDLKRAIFARMDEVCKPEAILATNTSSLSVTEIAVATHRPGKVIGLHFFNPAPVMKLVEVVRSVVTEQDVVDDVEAFAQRLGKVDVTIGDRAGFIANALLFGYLNHAAAMYESHYAIREDIDAAMTLGCGLPMGPLALIDLIGLDTSYEILDTMYQQTRDRLHAPTSDLEADDHRRLARTQGRPRLLHLRRTGFAHRRRGRDGASAGAHRHSAAGRARSGVVGSGVMATGIVEVLRARRLRRDVRRAQLGQGRSGAGRGGAIHGEGRPARQARCDAARDAAIAADHVVGPARRPGRRPVWSSRRWSRTSRVKQALFSNLDEICAPGTVLATTTSSLPVIECAAATSRPGDVDRHALLQPGGDHAARRGGVDGVDDARRRGHRAGGLPPASASGPCDAPTGPGSSSTRCSSRTSTTR